MRRKCWSSMRYLPNCFSEESRCSPGLGVTDSGEHLLFRRKQMLSRLGRNGQWSSWLRQQRISRSTADRLVLQYAESHGLTDDLRHREIAEPLEGNVCSAAQRTYKRLKNMLSTPRSRLM